MKGGWSLFVPWFISVPHTLIMTIENEYVIDLVYCIPFEISAIIRTNILELWIMTNEEIVSRILMQNRGSDVCFAHLSCQANAGAEFAALPLSPFRDLEPNKIRLQLSTWFLTLQKYWIWGDSQRLIMTLDRIFDLVKIVILSQFCGPTIKIEDRKRIDAFGMCGLIQRNALHITAQENN